MLIYVFFCYDLFQLSFSVSSHLKMNINTIFTFWKTEYVFSNLVWEITFAVNVADLINSLPF